MQFSKLFMRSPMRSRSSSKAGNGLTRRLIFVGGAPRSGTTVAQALICGSKRTNDYSTEISFVTQLFRSYQVGLNTWEHHTKHYHRTKSEFAAHVREIIDVALSHIAHVAGEPDMLCLKDPPLTPLFPLIANIYPDDARFVTILRHAYAVVRSRQEVAAEAGEAFGELQVRQVCKQYLASYQHLSSPRLKGRLLILRYEDLLRDETVLSLREFTGCPDISLDHVWGRLQRMEPAPPRATGNPWYSPKYRRPIDLGSRLDELAPKFKQISDSVCGDFMREHGYAIETIGS